LQKRIKIIIVIIIIKLKMRKREKMEYELLSSMRVLNGIISSTMSQVINGNSIFVFAGEIRKPKRLLNDDLVVAVLIILHIGFGVEDVDIVRREEVEVSN
jgi:hypothetical protein